MGVDLLLNQVGVDVVIKLHGRVFVIKPRGSSQQCPRGKWPNTGRSTGGSTLMSRMWRRQWQRREEKKFLGEG